MGEYSHQVIFEERPKESEGANGMNIWGTFQAKAIACAKTLRLNVLQCLKKGKDANESEQSKPEKNIKKWYKSYSKSWSYCVM